MKKIIIILSTIFLSVQMFGQINCNIGYINSLYNYDENNYLVYTEGKGLFLGVNTDIFSTNYNNFSISPGLALDFIDYWYDSVDRIEFYMRFPLHVKYVYNIKNNTNIFFSLGPSPVLLFGNKTKVKYENVSYKQWENIGKFDILFGFEIGINISNTIRLIGGYDFGLVNQNDCNDCVIKRNLLHFGIGYIL